MKKRVGYLLGSLVVLAAIIVAILYYNGAFKQMDPSNFAIKNTNKIWKIYLADMQGDTILLKKKQKGHWIVNDTFRARQSSVDELLRTMRLIEAVKPISKASTENVTKGMMVENTKVEAYDKDGDLIKSYFVGSEAQGNTGNYMMREGADEIFVVQIPGLQAVLHTRYYTNLKQWRDRTVFSYQPGEIAQVKMEYNFVPSESFQLDVISRDSFQLQPLSSKAPEVESQPQTRDMAKFVNSFRSLKAEAYYNGYQKKDSILAQQPYCIISVTDTAGKVTRAELYYKPISRRTKAQMDPEGNRLPYDKDRSFALINDGHDFVLIQQFVFGKILRQYKHFFEEPAGREKSM